MLTRTAAAAGGLLLAGDPLTAWWQGAQPDLLAQRRAQSGAIPIATQKLADNLVMLSGPGGNVAVLTGPDGLFVVDTFVQPAWPALKKTLDGLGAPIKAAIDTHWHFDHSDNNASFRQAGAAVIAHANTTKRLSETLEVLGMKFEPVPETAKPSQTFSDTHRLTANGENVELGYIPPAHTDTDIYIRFPRANVLHLGDTYFNGGYPFFDTVTRGNIAGMIDAANRGLKLADGTTKIIPGHGPLGDMKTLTAYRDMLVTARDRVQKLKASGRKLEEVVKEKPTADLDGVWGKGFMTPEAFVTLVYQTV
jgi:glyoxylase-like metal-dependent hydrolase (beta-lactamase superfamily II)